MTRGCGERVQGGMYVVVPTSPFGRPLEDFLVDYPVPWTGPRLRSPMLVEQDGVTHVLMGVGAEHYPFAPDFIEEARQLGVSKRVPLHFAQRDLARLTPGKSSLTLIHPRAIPGFAFDAEYGCPRSERVTKTRAISFTSPKSLATAQSMGVHMDSDPKCIGALWPLSAYDAGKKHVCIREASNDGVVAHITTPSVSYTVDPAESPRYQGDLNRMPVGLEWQPGLFLRFPSFSFEYVSKRGSAPKALVDACGKSGYGFEVKPS